MSNLSELLPTGGGQNAVDFVASGTLSSGQTVSLKSDGTVEAVSISIDTTPTAGTPEVFELGATYYTSSAYDSTNNKIIVAYSDNGNSNYGTAVVGTISGTSISFGTPVVFESAFALWITTVYDSANGKIVIAYRDNGNSSYGTAIVGTVSGTSISFGSPVVFNTANSVYCKATFDSTNNKVIIAYTDYGNSGYGTAIVGTVSGTSISFGSETVFEYATSAHIGITYDTANNKVVIAYRDDGNSLYGTAIVGTVSGTSISFGSPVVFLAASFPGYIDPVYDSANGKIVIAYTDLSNSSYGTSIVGTVSGTSISFGSPVVFESAASYYVSASYDASNEKVSIAYQDIGNSNYGTAIVGTVSGTSISFGTPVVFEAAALENTYTASSYDSANKVVVISYSDGGSSNRGTSVVFRTQLVTSNSADFIGITAGAISDTATGAVNVYGGINEAQTGLTIGADYYVQEDGSLSTTASDVKVGQAISATTINMMDLT